MAHHSGESREDHEDLEDHQDHEELVTRASQGDSLAVDGLLERHLPALTAFLRLKAGPLIRKNESCVDIVQSVCRGALEDIDGGGFEYRGEAPFRKWLFTKAMAKLVDRKRFYLAERRHPDRLLDLEGLGTHVGIEAVYASMCSPATAAVAREDIARFEAAFDRLPPEYQDVITLSRIHGMSHAEVGAEMNRSEGATRILLHRAMARLGLLMQEEEDKGSSS